MLRRRSSSDTSWLLEGCSHALWSHIELTGITGIIQWRLGSQGTYHPGKWWEVPQVVASSRCRRCILCWYGGWPSSARQRDERLARQLVELLMNPTGLIIWKSSKNVYWFLINWSPIKPYGRSLCILVLVWLPHHVFNSIATPRLKIPLVPVRPSCL